MSVARVAQAEHVNSHQVFQWRRAYRAGELVETGKDDASLLPVVVAKADSEPGLLTKVQPQQQVPAAGKIHIELSTGARVSVEHGADCAVLKIILESLRK
jgi:transposase-like protein